MKTHLLKIVFGLFMANILFTSCTYSRYKGYKEKSQMSRSFDRYSKNLCKKKDLQCLMMSNRRDPDIEYSLTMCSAKSMPYDEARPFAIGLVEDLWQMIQKSRSVNKHFNYMCKILNFHNKKLSIMNVGYALVFQDTNGDYHLSPYIAQVLFADEIFYYYEANPKTKKLRLIHRESYDEAMQFYKKQEAVIKK